MFDWAPFYPLQVCNILSQESVSALCLHGNSRFDLCLDKGTYDAISLRDASDPTDRKMYATSVHSLLSDQGRLVITSCNWTKEQLVLHFESGENRMTLSARLMHAIV